MLPQDCPLPSETSLQTSCGQPPRDLAAGFREQVEATFSDLAAYCQDYQQAVEIDSTIEAASEVFDGEAVAEETEIAVLEILL